MIHIPKTPNVVDFLKTVKENEMEILLDTTSHRHIRFTGGTHCFDIITWPDHLCVAGRLGNFLFRRDGDMFNFFRSASNAPITINPHYWYEKLKAYDSDRLAIKFNIETFGDSCIDAIKQYFLPDQMHHKHQEELEDLLEDFSSDVLRDDWDDVKQIVKNNLENYSFMFKDKTFFSFTEEQCEEISGDDFTYSFIWSCYAIAWGIQQYDVFRSKTN